MEGDFPVAFPVNYRLVPGPKGEARVVIRTRSGSVLDRAEERVSIEIDGVDGLTDSGWSVVCRGILRRVRPTDDWLIGSDPRPWVEGRDVWQYIEPHHITGRVVTQPMVTWELSLRGYL